MTTLRDDIRSILRADWGGRSTNSIALELGQPRERIRHALKNLKEREEVVRGDDSQWYWRRSNGIVPERVGVYRTPEKAPEIPLIKAGPEALQELIDDLDKVSFVPEDKLEQAPAVEQMVTVSMTVPSSLARQILALLP